MSERLTPFQHLILLAAAGVDLDDWIPAFAVVPHGVYRSLVIRGLLRPHPRGYAITDEGRSALTDLRTIERRSYFVSLPPKKRDRRLLSDFLES
jgi:hypothetical protein